MCTTPLMINGYEVSCRECDQCVSTYKNSWVSRCVAEKQTMPHAYAITLTYADTMTQIDGEWVMHPPLGARVYRYKDVSNMWKRIRSAAKRKWKDEEFEMRYVIVGEKGTKYGRCHYHGVVFASHPIHELGQLKGKKSNEFAYKRRLDWSIWGHGFVEFQMADRKGMAYVLKYILKSRMTAERSKGHAREGKTEWLASSYLWCSKRPAVGAEWLWMKLNDLVGKGMCPPALRVRVPGGGDWYIQGKLQKEMCLFLHQANNEYREERGRNLAGWSTLIESVQDEIQNAETGEMMQRKPMEWLTNGEEEEQEQSGTAEQAENEYQQFREWYARKRRIAAPITNARKALRKCGNIRPCDKCWRALPQHRRDDIDQELRLWAHEWRERNPPGKREGRNEYFDRFKAWWLTRLRPSSGCGLNPNVHKQFARLVPVTKITPGISHKAAIGGALKVPSR